MMRKVLLRIANADPGYPVAFYKLKDKLLRTHAEFRGHDMQEIVKECWGDQWHDDGYLYGCGPNCTRCRGTGIWDITWHRLQRWRWGDDIFHIPDGSTKERPQSVQIRGRIEHRDYGRMSREAELWLYLMCGQWLMWWQAVTTSCYCRPGWWPMCRLQKIAMTLRLKLERRTCYCGRRFMTWGSGYCMCRKCRQPVPGDELPF